MTVPKPVLLPLLILVLALGLTWMLWDHERQASQQELRAQFDISLREAVSHVEQRMATNEQMLRGMQGLLNATGLTDRDSLRNYVEALDLNANYSGVQTIGISEWVPPSKKSEHIAHMRQLGFKGYEIQPAGQRENYAPVIQREPNLGSTQISPGFDSWSEPVRRMAMEKARDSGMAAMTGKLRLMVDLKSEDRAGFIMYMPLYARGQSHNTVTERRANLIGWVFVSFRMSDLMSSLYGEQAPGLDLAIYDGVDLAPQSLLYPAHEGTGQAPTSALSANEYLVVAGHSWTLVLRAQDEFKARFGRHAELMIATAGTCLSFLLALLAWLMSTGRHRAVRLAAKMTEELRKSESLFRLGFENANIGMCLVDLKGQLFKVNRQMCEIFGYSKAELEGMHVNDLTHPDDLEANPKSIWQTEKGWVDHYEFEKRYLDKKGRLIFGQVASSLLRNADGEPMYFISHVVDVTQRKLAEAELRMNAVAFDSQEGIVVTDAKSVILRVNRAFTDITGYTAEDAVGQTPRLLQSGRHNAEFFRKMWETIHRTGGWQGEIWDRRKNGEVYPKWLCITAVRGEDGVVTNYIGTHYDITERKKAEEKIEVLAFFDTLTHLPNRTLLRDRLNQAMTASHRNGTLGAVLFIDLDHFKALNDSLGHDKGDQLLLQVAQRLVESVREGDTVARLGGDEFVVVLDSLSENRQEATRQTRVIGEKILASLKHAFLLGEANYLSTASIGATLFRGHAMQIDDLLKQADIAMYQSKDAGRNTLNFFEVEPQTVAQPQSVSS